MIEIFKKIDNNTLLGLISLLIGVLGIVLAIFFYIRSKRKKKANYYLISYNIVSDNMSNIKDLEFLFKGDKV
jgi:hypothetical protein